MPFEIDVQLDLGGTLVLKRSQVGIKIDQKSVLGGSKIGLGMSLRGLWRGLGGQNRKPRRGISFLEVSWGHLGGLLGPSWGLLGFQKKAKSVQKAIQKSIKILLHVGIDFWTDFGRFWGAKQGQVGSKIDTKSMLISKNDFFKKLRFS